MRKKEIVPVQLDKIYKNLEKKPIPVQYDEFLKVFDENFIEKTQDFIIDQWKGHSTDFFSPGIHVWEGTMYINESQKLMVTILQPVVQMIFCLAGNIAHHIKNGKNQYEKSQHNIIYVPEGEILLEFKPAEKTHLVIIGLNLDFFSRYYPKQIEKFAGFQYLIHKNQAARLSASNMILPPRNKFILQELIRSDNINSHKRLFIEAKVIELLGQQFEQFEESGSEETPHPLKPAEIEKMYKVRSIILENLSVHYSLVELAQQVGTNECYLKGHFKKVFGITVYGFTLRAKMEKAREMIISGRNNISQIAKATGYKYTAHFTTNFKKHFGVLPTKFKVLLMMGIPELEGLVMLF